MTLSKPNTAKEKCCPISQVAGPVPRTREQSRGSRAAPAANGAGPASATDHGPGGPQPPPRPTPRAAAAHGPAAAEASQRRPSRGEEIKAHRKHPRGSPAAGEAPVGAPRPDPPAGRRGRSLRRPLPSLPPLPPGSR